MFLLDTMVLSERTKTRPDSHARAWQQVLPPGEQFISVITIGEIRFGIARLPPSAKKRRLEAWLAGVLALFQGRVLPVDLSVAQRWGELRALSSHTLPLADSLIGATALVHNLSVATRNVGHFSSLGVQVIDPWQA